MSKKKKTTKRNLISSIISLILCVSMLIGTTFAWFTDSVSSGVNKIQAGNLDIEVDYSTDGNTWTSIEGTDSLFSDKLWEPGHTEYVYLRVKNAGTLALKYKAMVSPVSENGGINVYNENFKLSDYLVFGTTATADRLTTYANRAAARSAVGSTQKLNQTSLNKEAKLEPNQEQYFTLVVYMPETVDNHANAKPGTTAPSIDLGIKVVATQVENEEDSFGPDYDEDAVNDPDYIAGPYYNYFEAVNQSTTAGDDGKFTVTKEDNNTGVIASVSGEATAGSTVNLVVTKVSTPAGNFGITVNNGEELNGYDIKVTGQQENSVVQGKLFVGTGLEDFKFYHNGQPMNDGTQGSLTDGQYYYDKDNGYVYFATKTFSPFQATYKAPVAAIGTAVYGTLDDAINAASSGATITLLKDSTGKGIGSLDASKTTARRNSLTIDFNGHAYTMLNPAVGSSGTETQAMHWGTSLGAVTLKNGTFKVDDNASEVAMAMQNYINFTAENMTFDFTAIPVYNYPDYAGTNYEQYSFLEIPLFNNGDGGTMALRNCTISMPASSLKGISNDGNVITIDSCTINGAVVMESANKVVKVKNSVITKGVSPYFNSGYTVKTSEAVDGYTVYTNQTVVNISNTEQLANAISQNSEVTVKLTEAGTYNLPEMSSDKEVSIIGTKDTVIDMKNKVNKAKSISFEGVTVNFGDNNYCGFQHTGKLTYRDCTITGMQFLYADEVEFNNCVFEQVIVEYNVWTYGAKNVLFKDCTFNCAGKSVLIYNEGSNGQTVEFKNCKFNATAPVVSKAAIEIDSSLLKNDDIYTVIIDQATANSVSGFSTGSVSKNSVWNNKKGEKATVIVAGSTVLSAG